MASDLLQAGAPLPEVGQVLRHRSQLSTATYAKVDRDRLRALARPWPGGAAVSGLRQAAEDYLAMRRALGFALVREGQMLMSFISALEQAGAASITTELAVDLGEDAHAPA